MNAPEPPIPDGATLRRWGKLAPGEWILCPVSGLPERVVFNRPYIKGKRVVRTSAHDHFPRTVATVYVVERPEWAPR